MQHCCKMKFVLLSPLFRFCFLPPPFFFQSGPCSPCSGHGTEAHCSGCSGNNAAGLILLELGPCSGSGGGLLCASPGARCRAFSPLQAFGMLTIGCPGSAFRKHSSPAASAHCWCSAHPKQVPGSSGCTAKADLRTWTAAPRTSALLQEWPCCDGMEAAKTTRLVLT